MSNPKKVLFVTRDKKPGMVATRIARILQAQGAEIRVVAEGLSVAEWKGAGFDNCIVAEGPLDIKEPWGISPPTILSQVQPGVVVVGLSSPIRSEAWFASATRPQGTLFRGIPLVVMDDNWGATYRCQVQSDLVLTIDNLGARLVEGNPVYKGHDYKVEIVGDLSMSAIEEPIPRATVDAFNAAKGDAEYAFILCSQKWPESDDIISIALESCALSLKAGAKLVVIPRFHPGARPEDRERWNDMIASFAHTYPKALSDVDPKHNTDHLAALADGVFAATGSALRAAAYAGKFPICVWTPRLGEKLKAESGMDHHPLFIAQAAMQITGRVDVVALLARHGERVHKNQKELLQPVSFDVVKAAEAILAIAK